MLRNLAAKSCLRSIQRASVGQTTFKPRQFARQPYQKTFSSTPPTSPSTTTTTSATTAKYAKTRAGTGSMDGTHSAEDSMIPRGPVSWVSLGLIAVVAATAVGYYQIERERRLENAMGKIVSSESGWSPNPEYFQRRKFKKTKYGWFPVEDAFGGG